MTNPALTQGDNPPDLSVSLAEIAGLISYVQILVTSCEEVAPESDLIGPVRTIGKHLHEIMERMEACIEQELSSQEGRP
ncbi:MAG: hypothetical protein ACD_74C00138G0006 [uncultured bacterium]|nr:MAG: hypothetical protein ACD_74C00138G0006 [uncultured bacterium]